jgi:hypothetical protein
MAIYLLLSFLGPALGTNPNVAKLRPGGYIASYSPPVVFPPAKNAYFHHLWVESYTICQGMSNTSFRKDSTLLVKACQQKLPGTNIGTYPKG